MGVRDELVGWGRGEQDFFYSDRRVGAGSGLVGLDWSETETADGERERGLLWHGRGGAGLRPTPLAACRHVVIVCFR